VSLALLLALLLQSSPRNASVAGDVLCDLVRQAGRERSQHTMRLGVGGGGVGGLSSVRVAGKLRGGRPLLSRRRSWVGPLRLAVRARGDLGSHLGLREIESDEQSHTSTVVTSPAPSLPLKMAGCQPAPGTSLSRVAPPRVRSRWGHARALQPAAATAPPLASPAERMRSAPTQLRHNATQWLCVVQRWKSCES
jgi:hypothetical protein